MLIEDKKRVKKEVGKLARTLIYYEATMLVVGILYIAGYMIVKLLSNQDALLTEGFTDAIMESMLGSGMPSLLGVVCGMGFILLYRKKKLFTYDLVTVNKRMKKGAFVQILFCFMSIQTVFTIFSIIVEGGFNYFGYTVLEQIETASETSTTMSMFLYASLLGPVVEEIIFRGVVLRSLEGYGKIFAIVVSALLFGSLHGNIVQGIFATVIGIVLGYVALEYSIKWTILLHIINNFIFGDLLGFLIKDLSLALQNMISNGITFIFFIGGVIIFLKQRHHIKNYLSINKTEKGVYQATFTSIWFIIFILLNVLIALSGVEKLNL